MNAALRVEALKLFRSPAARVAGVVLGVLVPTLAAAFMAVARSDSNATMAAKVNPFHIGNWNYPFTIEVPGEVIYREDTMPGLNAARMTATAIKGQSYSDVFGYVPCGTLTAVNQGLHSHISSLYDSCRAYDLWND